jgi:hypothetical protein
MLLLSTTWCIPYLGVSCAGCSNSRIGAITNNSNFAAIPAATIATAAATIQPCSYSVATVDCHQAAIVVSL